MRDDRDSLVTCILRQRLRDRSRSARRPGIPVAIKASDGGHSDHPELTASTLGQGGLPPPIMQMPLTTFINSSSLELKIHGNTNVRCSSGNATHSAGMIRPMSNVLPSPTAASHTADSPVFATPRSTADGSEMFRPPKLSRGCVPADQSHGKVITL